MLDKESLKEIKGHKVIKKQENDLGGYFTGENFDILFLLICIYFIICHCR